MPEAPVAIFDTSLLFDPRRRKVIGWCAHLGIVDACWSPHIIAELNRVLAVTWIEATCKEGSMKKPDPGWKRMSRASKDMMSAMTRTFRVVNTPNAGDPDGTIRDDDDHHLMDAARAAGAAYVVSENTHNFPAADALGRHLVDDIEFLTYEKFLERLSIDEEAMLADERRLAGPPPPAESVDAVSPSAT